MPKRQSNGGVYDTWALGGGDVRKITNLTLSPSVVFDELLWGVENKRRFGDS